MSRYLCLLILIAAGAVESLEEYQFLGSCDEKSVPYRITVNEHGKPEIFCASPTCLGDSYLDGERHIRHGAYRVSCNGYRDEQCLEQDQWTAGFMEAKNGSNANFKSKCCSYPGLLQAKPVKKVVLQPDEEFTGGAYIRSEGVGGFDVIKEVKRRVHQGIVKYDVTVVRMPCQLDVEAAESDYDHEPRKQTGYKPYHGEPASRRRPLYRSPFRPFGFRRRNYVDDYYNDYEEDYYYQPRRKFELQGVRGRLRTGGNVLWPIAYQSRGARVYGQDIAEGDAYGPSKVIQVPLSSPDMVLVVQQPNQRGYPTEQQDSYSQKSQVGPVAPQQVQQAQQPVEQSYQQGPPQVPQPPVGGSYGPMTPPIPDIPQINHQPVITADQTAAGGQYVQAAQPTIQQVYHGGYQQSSYAQAPSSYQSSYSSGSCGTTCPSCCASGSGLNGLFGSMQCFSEDDEVLTLTGMKKMKDIEVGDMVMSMDENVVTYSPVVMFLHRLEDQDAEFIKFTTADNKTMELTPQHLIYTSQCLINDVPKLVAAHKLTVGTCVSIPDGRGGLQATVIKQLELVEKKGIYAPLTFTGDIFVNGILTSCHSNVGIKILQQSFFTTYKAISSFFQQMISFDIFSYGKELPLGTMMVTNAMDLFLPHSYL